MGQIVHSIWGGVHRIWLGVHRIWGEVNSRIGVGGR